MAEEKLTDDLQATFCGHVTQYYRVYWRTDHQLYKLLVTVLLVVLSMYTITLFTVSFEHQARTPCPLRSPLAFAANGLASKSHRRRPFTHRQYSPSLVLLASHCTPVTAWPSRGRL